MTSAYRTVLDLLDELLEAREKRPSSGLHKHRCGRCGCIWAHDDGCANSEKAHTCPECHVVLEGRWEWYEGPLEAVVRTCQNLAIRPFRKVA